jgi:tRNA G18 (ribose-2'-O)-methylase SpoU
MKNSKGIQIDDPSLFVIEGFSALKEYLVYAPAKIVNIVAHRGQHIKIRENLRDTKISIFEPEQWEKKHGSSVLSRSSVWAIVRVATLSERDLPQLEKVFDQSIVLALDHVTDPRNLGAIVRTAAYYGIKYVVLPKDRQVSLTPASVSTAQGGFALTSLVVVTNLARFLGVLKSKQYWIIGAALEGKPFRGVELNFTKRVLVLGAESKGLSPIIRSKCDLLVSIVGSSSGIDSLNVSVATGVLVDHLMGITENFAK